jgi:hypothetical protein
MSQTPVLSVTQGNARVDRFDPPAMPGAGAALDHVKLASDRDNRANRAAALDCVGMDDSTV